MRVFFIYFLPMLRLTPSIGLCKLSVETIKRLTPEFQPVRWRKPIWLGTAKSKLFRVPKRPVIPDDESEELKRLNNKYRTEVKSLRQYLTRKYQSLSETNEDPQIQQQVFAEDFARCKEINEKWNAEIKILREKRAASQLEADLAFAKERISHEMLKQEKLTEVVEELVRKEKEISKTFITPENIDAAIEIALENEVDYNFAINAAGEKIMGREGKPQDMPEKIKIRQ
ncbi:small ribosomal subunit protein mS26 [Cylas formicarius]|uniref:small ribosomal subunit protein mS26 n=1 Tax=Cylas formicarius TaxID=197179 RepID=UPI0029589F57|nr:small ribosomal subunit protein mS26 [Cylas formicarius]